MTTPQQALSSLYEAAQATPFTVEPAPDGAVVRWDLGNERWFSPSGIRSETQVASVRVRVAPNGTYTRTTSLHEVDTSGGPGGLRYGRSVKKGTVYSKSFGAEASVGPGGPQAGTTSFDTTQLTGFVDQHLQGLGLKKQMDPATRIGLIAGIAGIVVALVAVVLALVL